MIRAESQLQIRIRLAILDLTPRRRLSPAPRNALAAAIRRLDGHRASREAVAKDIAHVVPDLVDIEIVGENRLADIGLENSALNGGYLQRNTARHGVASERLAVRSILCNGVLRADAAADGPEVDGFIALVRYDCAADSLDTGDEGDKSECVEEHCM